MQAICDERLPRSHALPLPPWEVLEMAKHPQARFGSAQEMAERLADVCRPAKDVELSWLTAKYLPDRLREFNQLDRMEAAAGRPGVPVTDGGEETRVRPPPQRKPAR